jgi:beta-phosphoglucomutase family hydrolase
MHAGDARIDGHTDSQADSHPRSHPDGGADAPAGGGRPLHSAHSTYDAVIFDMDGVVTETATVHAAAWKALFDEVLPQLGVGPFVPFDAVTDYRKYVDGRPREDGIRTFLASRRITLSEGGPDAAGENPADGGDYDSRAALTVSALAARKQSYFDATLAADGVVAFPDAVALLHRLRDQGVRTAIVTSSRNCREVLEAAGVADLFDVRVDGADAIRLHLPGKPDPSVFLEAARQLGLAPGRAIVIEDAEAGVTAGSRGGFGLVVGMDRAGIGERLRAAGADLVLSDLGELDLSQVRGSAHPSGDDSSDDPWVLRYEGFDPRDEGRREALCTLGNGYWGTRGAAGESVADAVHYPGTYFAGVYNRARTDFGTRTVEDEHMVNAPNWLSLRFRADGNEWFSISDPGLLDYRQELDLRRAVLTRTFRFRDAAGRTTRVTSRRFVSHADTHVGVAQTTFEAEDWSGPMTVQSAIDGRVVNLNVTDDRQLNDTHLATLQSRQIDDETVLLEAVTIDSGIRIAMAQRTRVFDGSTQREMDARYRDRDAGMVAHELVLHLEERKPQTVDKTVVVATSRDRAISSPVSAVTTWIRRLPQPAEIEAAHRDEWKMLWADFHVELLASGRHNAGRADTPVGGHHSLALNLNTFHVLQSVAAGDVDLDAGVPARGLHGEGYRGHVFWDEMFVYPMITLRRPDLSRSLLGYRYRRLDEAREAARAGGFRGAMFPWQSGIDGRELTPRELFNPRTGKWMPDNSYHQRHVGIAIAYSVWQYYEATGDVDFLIRQGAELLLEVARFFASLTTYDAAGDRFSIDGVMGPDEFHDGNPGGAGLGIRNNAYTNVMTAWVLRRAVRTVSLLEGRSSGLLWNRIRLEPGETAAWEHISRRLTVPFDENGLISQFEGYSSLPEFDWDRYRSRYPSLGRLDLILNAEGDSTNNYRLSKQADTLMLLYLLSAEELRELLEDMGYSLAPEEIVRMVDFYSFRSTHGSTLSNVVESWVESRRNRESSWESFSRALDSDLVDSPGSTTQEGIHLGAMAGSVDLAVRCYTGLEIRDGILRLNPVLPAELDSISFRINYREQVMQIVVSSDHLRIRVSPGGADPVVVSVRGEKATLRGGQSHDFALGN